MSISDVCQKCKTERPTTRSREVYTKNYKGPCGDSFCYASCDLEACRPLMIVICDACERLLARPVSSLKDQQEPLVAPDPEQCQAEITTTLGFMVLGGPPKTTERCKKKPTTIAIETQAGVDGRKGSMSLCDECKGVMEKEVPKSAVKYVAIELVKTKEASRRTRESSKEQRTTRKR